MFQSLRRSVVSAVVFNWGHRNHKSGRQGYQMKRSIRPGSLPQDWEAFYVWELGNRTGLSIQTLLLLFSWVPLAKTARIIVPGLQYSYTMISAQKRNSDKELRITKHLLTLQVLLCSSTVSVMLALKVTHCTQIAAAKASKDVKTRFCKRTFLFSGNFNKINGSIRFFYSHKRSTIVCGVVRVVISTSILVWPRLTTNDRCSRNCINVQSVVSADDLQH